MIILEHDKYCVPVRTGKPGEGQARQTWGGEVVQKRLSKGKPAGNTGWGQEFVIRRKFVEKGHELNMLNVRLIRQQSRHLAMPV